MACECNNKILCKNLSAKLKEESVQKKVCVNIDSLGGRFDSIDLALVFWNRFINILCV